VYDLQQNNQKMIFFKIEIHVLTKRTERLKSNKIFGNKADKFQHKNISLKHDVKQLNTHFLSTV